MGGIANNLQASGTNGSGTTSPEGLRVGRGTKQQPFGLSTGQGPCLVPCPVAGIRTDRATSNDEATMTMVLEALGRFLRARQTAANADLIAGWSPAMETQVNVLQGDGEQVAGKRGTWSNGTETWWNIRIPHDAATDPTWDDYPLPFPFDERAEGIGMTGWDWQARRSRRVGFDFDAITDHAKGLTPEELERVEQAAAVLPYIETRNSTGGKAIHLYVYFDAAGIATANHGEHAALARCVLAKMSRDVGFDFQAKIDVCGGVMWVWHRKMTAENQGLALIKAATQQLTEADLPADWRATIEKPEKKESTPRARHPVDDDFIRNGDFGAFLRDLGWRQSGDNYAHPHTDKPISLSIVKAEDGTRVAHTFTSSVPQLKEGGNYNAFDLFRLLCHDGDTEAARAALVKQGFGRKRITLLTSSQLDSNAYKIDYLIERAFVARQPCILAGSKKTLKTSLLVDLLLSLAMGTPFLGHMDVTRLCKVLLLSGESGLATLQETARRISAAKGFNLSDVTNLSWSDNILRLDKPPDLDALDRAIQETGCEVLGVDPAYLYLPGIDAANIFVQGEMLGRISEVCQRHGAALILAHHMRKRGKNDRTYEVPELDDISFAGFAEFARQWLLLGRREAYEPGSGEHRLWLSIGGSAGHSALWAVDVSEGVSGEPRHWKVTLSTPDVARAEKKAGSIRDRLLDALRQFPQGETKSTIFAVAKVKTDPASRFVFDALLDEGRLVPHGVKKHGVIYPGFCLAAGGPAA
jgi:hypothetical protein